MHFYGWNIDAYLRDTAHLDLFEDLAYRRMLDLYYRDEGPLRGDAASIARLIRMREHVAAVAIVLQEFFQPSEDAWRNPRADAEIAAYRAKREAAAAAGRQSGVKRRSTDVEPTPNDRSTDAQPINPNPQPQNPVPQPPLVVGTTTPPRGVQGGMGPEEASPSTGDGERGAGEQQALFAFLCGTKIRSKAKNRRKVLSEMAADLTAQGMTLDMLRRLLAKARQESNGEPDALLAHWLDTGTWREQWNEILGHRASREVRRVVAARSSHA